MSEVPNRESIDRPLKALRGAGTVFGVLFFRGTEVVFNETPYSDTRVQELSATLDDIFFFFVNEGRDIDQLSFGFDGGSMLIVSDQEYRVVVLHSLVDEVDFIAKATRAFLIDYQMGIFAAELNDKGAENAEAIASGEVPEESKPVVATAQINLDPVDSAEDADEDSATTGPIRPILDRPATQPIPAAQNPSSRENSAPVPPQEEAQAKTAHLAANQPESTLPPPRKPKIRR